MDRNDRARQWHHIAMTRSDTHLSHDRYLEAMQDLLHDSPSTGGSRPYRWARSLLAFEDFAHRTGRRARETTRQRADLPAQERRLSEWSRRQRERWSSLSSYQQARLTVSPVFALDRRASRWQARCRDCVGFVRDHSGALPGLSRASARERSLSRWWRQQVAQMRGGVLSRHRAEQIELLLTLSRSYRSRPVPLSRPQGQPSAPVAETTSSGRRS